MEWERVKRIGTARKIAKTMTESATNEAMSGAADATLWKDCFGEWLARARA